MEDLRKVKSKELLKKAFWEVLEKKKYRAITIKDIVECAGLNRKTFNAHYEDVDSLMTECIHILFDGLLLQFQQSKLDGSKDFAAGTRAYTKFALDNQKQLRLIFANNLDSVALQYWKIRSNRNKDPLSYHDLNALTPSQLDLFTYYTTYSCWGNLIWVLDHAEEMPFDDLVNEALRIFYLYLENYYLLYKD